MGIQFPLPQKGNSPQFSAHIYCGQKAICVTIPLGTEVGLSLGDIVLDADPAAPLLQGHVPPNFRPMPVVAKRLDEIKIHYLVWR